MGKRYYNKKHYADKVSRVESTLLKLGEPGEAIVDKYKGVDEDKPKNKLKKLGKAFRVLKEQIEDQIKYKEQPVEIEEFITSKRYLDMPVKPHMDEDGAIYPEVLKELKIMASGDFVEIVCTGSIGSAKTTVALILLAYNLYLISVLRDPHKEYSLLKSDEIIIIFQSLNAAQAKTVSYGRFKAMIQNSEYFKHNFTFNKNIESELQFPNRVIVKPIAGSATSSIGQNCIAGLIDEINFMKTVERSKNSKDSGTYDQAIENYESIVRRRESRFLKMGKIPGILCLVSSKRYPGEFTDRKIEEAKTNDKIYIYDKRVWDISPPGRYCGERFKIFLGDISNKPRLLLPNEEVPDIHKHLVDEIPIELKSSFEGDGLLGAIRDVAGKATLSIEPFILDVEKVAQCFGTYKSVLTRDDCDFKNTNIEIYTKRIHRKDQPRWVHIDLGLTGDCAGVTCGYVAGFKNIVKEEEDKKIVETLPVICIDFMLQVRPPPNGEILFHKIRSLIYKLSNAGMIIKWVTLDSWQSYDTKQLLKARGYRVGEQSMDTTTSPYDVTKGAFMDERILAPEHPKCHEEFISLERDVKRNKIDHVPNGSKDVSDSLAGVVFGLTTRAEIWASYGVPLTVIPSYLIDQANTNKNSIDGCRQGD